MSIGNDKQKCRPIVIAHRGASGYLPEHTLAGYWVALQQGADYIEPDLVMSRDGVLIARHENAIAVLNADGSVKEATTDVAERAEFAARKTTKTIDGEDIIGWFTEDFSVAELKTLRCKERLPALRAANTRFDGQFEIPTFDEILDLLDTANAMRQADAKRRGLSKPRPIGVYPETKHPSHFRGLGLPLDEALLAALTNHDLNREDAPVFLQSFEVGNLRQLRGMTRLPLIQLMNNSGQPWDFTVRGDPRTYADMASAAGLAEVAGYADGIGVHKDMMIPRDVAGRLVAPTDLIENAHRAGLQVHGWTFRAENFFLPADFRDATGAATRGDLQGEIAAFLDCGMDGFFTDQSDIGVKARNNCMAKPDHGS